MKYLYIWFAVVTVISAAVPQDLCETCVPSYDCPLFENLNVTEQLRWMEKFPCGSRKDDNFSVPGGFAAAAKGDYVCCSNNIWGVENPNNFGPRIGYQSGSNSQPSDNIVSKSKNNNLKDSSSNKLDYEDMNSTTPIVSNNDYYNNRSRGAVNVNDNIISPNLNVDNYNTNANNDNVFKKYYNGSTVWFPDRSPNYDNTDYWLNHIPDNNEDNNDMILWNNPPDREDPGVEARPPILSDTPDNGADSLVTNYPPPNIVRPPIQYDPPGKMGRPPYHDDPPENEPNFPITNYPPPNTRPPIQYDRPGNEPRPPNQFDQPGMEIKQPLVYNTPENTLSNYPFQNNPSPNVINPPSQNFPSGNEARPPILSDIPENGIDFPVTNYPPPNIVRPPIQYDSSGNMATSPYHYDHPGIYPGESQSGTPIQNMPPGYDDTMRPRDQYYTPGNFRPPNENYPSGNFRPPTENYPSENIRPPNENYPSGNFRPPTQNYSPGNFGPRNENYYPGNFGPRNENYYPDNSGTPNQYYPPGNSMPPNGNYPPGNSGPRNENYYPGNFGGGQCSVTSFPPDPQGGCCGRQLADDDRIMGNPAYNNNWGSRPQPDSKWRYTRSVPENDTEVTVENRISGGHATELYQYPWTVLLLTTFNYGQREAEFNCGGGLISAKYVLTAGHCVNEKGASIQSVKVHLAEYDKSTFPKDCKQTGRGQQCIENVVMYAEEVITHPQYENENLVNDIALLRLRGSVPYTAYIRPICLPSFNIDTPQYSKIQFEVAGWGRVGPYSSNIKQSTVLYLVNQNQCRAHYPQLTNKHLCAAGKNGKDTCKGDSGGPLMLQQSGRYYVVGIVSGKRSDSPCGTEVPSLYTNVYNYVAWIRSIIRN